MNEFPKGRSATAERLKTPLGPMLAIADENSLYLLEFENRRGFKRQLARLQEGTQLAIVPGKAALIDSIKEELAQYFAGSLLHFQTPITPMGTPFQKEVWSHLLKVPFGETCSYSDIARKMQRPKANRAVANAVGANPLAMIVPCHRVIRESGDLGGYAGGLDRKRWLLAHENK